MDQSIGGVGMDLKQYILAKKYTDFSTAKIGMIIGGKDHATVLHACKCVENQVSVDKAFKAELIEIESQLKK